MHFILVTRPKDAWLVGPFRTNDDAADYGATAQKELWSDNPCWQTIELQIEPGEKFELRIEIFDGSLKVRHGAYRRSHSVEALERT